MDILYIRGVIINDEELRVLIGKRIPAIWVQYQKYIREQPDENAWLLLCNESIFENGKSMIELIENELGIEIYTWVCCSELANKKYVLGYNMQQENIDDAYHNVITLYSHTDRDEDLAETFARLDIHKEICTVIMLDDCPYCS